MDLAVIRQDDPARATFAFKKGPDIKGIEIQGSFHCEFPQRYTACCLMLAVYRF